MQKATNDSDGRMDQADSAARVEQEEWDVRCWYVGRDRRLSDGRMLRAEALTPYFDSEPKANAALASVRRDVDSAYVVGLRVNFNPNAPERDAGRRAEFLALLV